MADFCLGWECCRVVFDEVTFEGTSCSTVANLIVKLFYDEPHPPAAAAASQACTMFKPHLVNNHFTELPSKVTWARHRIGECHISSEAFRAPSSCNALYLRSLVKLTSYKLRSRVRFPGEMSWGVAFMLADFTPRK